MIFPDYSKTQCIYHVVSIIDLKKTLKNGIVFDDKATYECKYLDFHNYIDKFKDSQIPDWVIRRKAIFGSLNFKDNHYFHSHTAVLKIKPNVARCWIANENLANENYEPFILKELDTDNQLNGYFDNVGDEILREYWSSSLSFIDNINRRKDRTHGYDAEILIFHDIKPEDIEVLFIRADHTVYSLKDFYKKFYFH